ncbi:PLDc N-terminal domain-containing protein (plasmid) [Exiguobacterium acetylicum]
MNTDFNALLEIDWNQILPFMLPILFFNLLLIIITLVDWFKRKDQIAIPYVWLLVILLIQLLGPILFLVIGRRIHRHDYGQ